jgi:hypothetical protein
VSFAATSEATELAYHVLAHVPQHGPGSSFDPRYHAWLAARGEHDPLALDDGVRVATLIEPRARELVHALPELYSDVGLPEACRHALAELAGSTVRTPALLRAMQRDGGVALELLHVMVGLTRAAHARRFADELAFALARSADALAVLSAQAGTLGAMLDEHRIELSWALGPRGRVLDGRIVVGAPAPWHGGTLASTAVLALHERCVAHGDGPWAPREWAALRELAIAIADAPAPLQLAHAEWLASLELGELLAGVHALGVLDPALAQRIRDDRRDRVALLRAT